MRGKPISKRKISPDSRFNNETVAKLINYVMVDGKKYTATSIVYKALDDLAEKTKLTPVEALEKALVNVQPRLEIRARRVGGANYQVPVPVQPHRQLTLSFRWLINAARANRGKKEFWESLSQELHSACKGEGDAVRKRDDIQRMADSNRAFAQFA